MKSHKNISQIFEKRLRTLVNHYNSGEFSDAEILALSITTDAPTNQLSWKILGSIFGSTGRLSEALEANRKAVQLDSEDAVALSNLGVTLKELGRFDESRRIYAKAIALKPNFSLVHLNLGRLLYIQGQRDLAFKSLERACSLDKKSKYNRLLIRLFEEKKIQSKKRYSRSCNDRLDFFRLSENPIIFKRKVEAKLLSNLKKLSYRQMNQTTDARYGNGRCSLNFDLFEDNSAVIDYASKDLAKIIKHKMGSDIYLFDSFFNILGSGGGSIPHNHLTNLDKDIWDDLGKRKFSLMYYLRVGDLDASEPGILNLYNPKVEILPEEGMIVIVPASRKHSAVYNGEAERIMIGMNFYCF